MVREAGLEPARPEWTLEPESSESANSTTRAFVRSLERSNILARSSEIVNTYFDDFLRNFFCFLSCKIDIPNSRCYYIKNNMEAFLWKTKSTFSPLKSITTR